MGFLLIRVEGPFLVSVPYARKTEWESEYFNFPLKNLVNPLLFIGGVCLWGTFVTTDAFENELSLRKLLHILFTPYHAIVFGIMLISGGASLWQMCDGNDFI